MYFFDVVTKTFSMKVLQIKKKRRSTKNCRKSLRPSALGVVFFGNYGISKIAAQFVLKKIFKRLQTQSVTLMHNSSTCLSCLVVIYEFSKSHRSIRRRR